MTITEQFICGKHTATDCEDGIVITPHFAAVIDGSTSKTPLRRNMQGVASLTSLPLRD